MRSVAAPKRHLTSRELPPLPFSPVPYRARGLRRRIEFLPGTSRSRQNEPRARLRRRAFRRPRQGAGSGSRRFRRESPGAQSRDRPPRAAALPARSPPHRAWEIPRLRLGSRGRWRKARTSLSPAIFPRPARPPAAGPPESIRRSERGRRAAGPPSSSALLLLDEITQRVDRGEGLDADFLVLDLDSKFLLQPKYQL